MAPSSSTPSSITTERPTIELRIRAFLIVHPSPSSEFSTLTLSIFDGGLFVFLIIEKIKGSPISLQVQVATQVIGLALIIGIFLVVTLQDIAKLVGWG